MSCSPSSCAVHARCSPVRSSWIVSGGWILKAPRMSWKSTLVTCVPSWRRRANHGSSTLFAVWATSSRNKTWYREFKSDVSKRIRRDMHTPKVTVFERGRPRSLRLRLLLWYGSLIAVAVGFFAMLFLILTTNAIEQSINSTVHAEARIAMLDTLDNLFPAPPYWQDPLSRQVVDTYRDPGVVVEVLDAQGQVRYLSTSGTRIPLSTNTTRMVLAGQPPVSYTTSVDGQHVRVEALPIRAPVHGVSGNATGVPMGNGPVIGVLLVAKSLSDVDATLLLLRALLLLSGIATLVGTLIASWLIATRVLRPLSALVTTARSIAASTARGTRLGNLSQRVPRPRGHDEMVQVVETFNEMLASLESATQANRGFSPVPSTNLRAPPTPFQGTSASLHLHLIDLRPRNRGTWLAIP